MCAAQSGLWDRPGSLDWRTFKVPEYGTRGEYPAGIFAAVGKAENGTESNAEHRSMIRSLLLFWGFPNQLSSDSWAVGFEEADHAALWIARRPMGADQRSSARARGSCGRQCSRQPAVR